MVSKVVKELKNLNLLGSSPRVGWERKSIGYDEEQTYLELMLKNVILGDSETGRKQSTSVIVYGIPGVGKTTLVETALAKLDRDPVFHDSRIVVRLSGLLCPDFRSSIEDIIWQLNFDNLFKDENEKEEDNEEDGTDGDVFKGLGSATNYDDRLDQIMEILRTDMEKLNKSMVFILDKLDRFAEHPNQRLLYNLYDLTANSKYTMPICVIGVTDRVDVLELFEKRVKSRFSHRNINLLPKYDFNKYNGIAQYLLTFPNTNSLKLKAGQLSWNESINQLFQNIKVQQILRAIFDSDPTILQLSIFLFSVLCLVKDKLTLAHFEQTFESKICINDSVSSALNLSITDLLALLSIYKQTQNNKQQAWQPMNLYKIVEKLMTQFGMGKGDYLKAIRKLEAMNMIVPVSNAQRKAGGGNNVAEVYYKCELAYPEFQEIWKKYPHLPSNFQEFL